LRFLFFPVISFSFSQCVVFVSIIAFFSGVELIFNKIHYLKVYCLMIDTKSFTESEGWLQF
jgi:uracil phosphoribosyltransferase